MNVNMHLSGKKYGTQRNVKYKVYLKIINKHENFPYIYI